MTMEDRVAIAQALWRSVELLVPAKAQAALDELRQGLEATYNAHGDVREADAYARAKREAQAAGDAAWQQANAQLEDERTKAFNAGMIAVKKRSDYRDLDDIKDPEELRSTH